MAAALQLITRTFRASTSKSELASTAARSSDARGALGARLRRICTTSFESMATRLILSSLWPSTPPHLISNRRGRRWTPAAPNHQSPREPRGTTRIFRLSRESEGLAGIGELLFFGSSRPRSLGTGLNVGHHQNRGTHHTLDSNPFNKAGISVQKAFARNSSSTSHFLRLVCADACHQDR